MFICSVPDEIKLLDSQFLSRTYRYLKNYYSYLKFILFSDCREYAFLIFNYNGYTFTFDYCFIDNDTCFRFEYSKDNFEGGSTCIKLDENLYNFIDNQLSKFNIKKSLSLFAFS